LKIASNGAVTILRPTSVAVEAGTTLVEGKGMLDTILAP
jgi:hypothetical protein